jgi:transcriptional regulator with PAS, ATPase and Fis domain
MAEDGEITPRDLGLLKNRPQAETNPFDAYLGMPLTEAKQMLSEDFERFAIERALEAEGKNVSAAARRLGIHRQSLQQKLKQWES